KYGNEQERQREIGNGLENPQQSGGVRGEALVEPSSQLHDDRDLGENNAYPAQDFEVLSGQRPDVTNIILLCRLMELDPFFLFLVCF
ncbi:MAG: hypothetical protein IJJ60_08275, partial [Clostridia bacterium]|nr:hypothetical protein [Clostridia bacterium]